MKGFFNTTHTNNAKIETKQDKKPNGIDDLIDNTTGTINKTYLGEVGTVESVNGQTGVVMLNASDVRAVDNFIEEMPNANIKRQSAIENTYDSVRVHKKTLENYGSGTFLVEEYFTDITKDGFVFKNGSENIRPRINENEEMAYLSDIETAIGDINSILDAINGEVI